MSTKGRWLLIFGITAVLSLIAFVMTVIMFGVRDNNFGIQIAGQQFNLTDGIRFGGFDMGNPGITINGNFYEFEKNNDYSGTMNGADITDINLALASCRATVNCTDSDSVSVHYRTGSTKVNFTAEVTDGRLNVEEKMNIGFNLFNFSAADSSELTLDIPKSLYNTINIDLASGKILSDGMTSDKLTANVASGTLELGAFADDISLNIASGRMILTNCTESKCGNVSLQAASGTVEMKGFGSDNTKVELASGSVQLDGISGKVKGELASGKLVLTYAEWNDDLDIELLSGKADITLPAGSGANASLSKLSGSMKIDLDGQSAKLTGNSSLTVGGSNIHSIKGDVASGSIDVHN